MPTDPEVFLALWHRAKAAEIGIAITTDNPRELTRHLYNARQGHDDLQDIRICHPAGGKEVWLVKATVEVL